MKHARRDYARIQDPEKQIPEDEPVFLLRAQDKVAAATVLAWAELNDAAGGDDQLSKIAREHAFEMRRWTPKKVADFPRKRRVAAEGLTVTGVALESRGEDLYVLLDLIDGRTVAVIREYAPLDGQTIGHHITALGLEYAANGNGEYAQAQKEYKKPLSDEPSTLQKIKNEQMSRRDKLAEAFRRAKRLGGRGEDELFAACELFFSPLDTKLGD